MHFSRLSVLLPKTTENEAAILVEPEGDSRVALAFAKFQNGKEMIEGDRLFKHGEDTKDGDRFE